MTTLRRTLAATATAALLAQALPAAAQEGGTRELTVSQAFQSLLYLPLYVGVDRGFFEAAGLEVDIETAGSGPTALNSVIAGSAELSLHGPEWTAIAFEKGAPVKTIANVVNGAAVWILADADFEYDGPESLSGESAVVGMMPTTSTSLFFKMLDEAGVDRGSIDDLQVQIGSEPAPFLGGQAPVAVMYEPGVDQAVAEGKKVIVSFPEAYGEYAFSTIMARKDIDPELAQPFVDGLQAALAFMQDDPEGAAEVAMSEFPNLAPEIVQAAVQRMVDEGVYAPSVEITEAAMSTSLGVQIALGNLEAEPPYADFVDRTFMDAATGGSE